MSKYYNKKIPIEINFVYGGRHYGKTYREFEKLKTRIEELVKENKKLKFAMKDTYDSANDTCGELQQRINKTIKYVEQIDDWDIKEFRRKELLKILKGE